MSVEHVEILVEEPSMEAALRILVPKMVGDLSHEIYPYQSKQQLLARLPDRLRGYKRWLPTDWRIVVVVDRDGDDCINLKAELEAMATKAGLITRSTRRSPRSRFSVVNRIVVEELEAWYFGDWEATCAAYPCLNPHQTARRGYRDPDEVAGGTWEALERVMKSRGYFATGLRKIEAARTIAQHMDPSRNTSRSFQVLRDALFEMAP